MLRATLLVLTIVAALVALGTPEADAGCVGPGVQAVLDAQHGSNSAALAAATPAPASSRAAPRPPTAAQVQTEAGQIMRLSADQFEALRRDPHRPTVFDWSTDGCSWTPSPWEKRFLRACHLHDFGYRNFGNGLRLGRDEATREWIDGRFQTEMLAICDRDYATRRAARLLCRTEARLMHLAVRVANHWG